MAEYTADLFTGAHMATGLTSPVERFLTAEERAALPQDAPRPRETNAAGEYLVDVECMRQVEQYGRRKTEVYSVRLPETPATAALQPGPVTFAGLTISVYVPKAGGLRESFRADGIATSNSRKAGE